jgi:hypothetical protein
LGSEGLGEASFWRVGGLGWLLWPLLRWQPSCFFVPGGKRNLMEQNTCLTLCQLYDHANGDGVLLDCNLGRLSII